jgi:hypothetical protein
MSVIQLKERTHGPGLALSKSSSGSNASRGSRRPTPRPSRRAWCRWRQRSHAAQADRLTGGGARLVCLLAPPHTPNQVLTSVMASAIRTGR